MLLNAVLCVWNEEDIIESTVRHLFAQGCANVFLIDNSSTDRTVDLAQKAGARLAASFKTEQFDEDQKVAHLNALVRHVNGTVPEERVWWLYADADEFPDINGPVTILEVLKQLDASIQAVHGNMFNHLPTHPPYHVQGYHPADFQPLCAQSSGSKIPLLRYDKGRRQFWSIGGAHDFITHGETAPTLKNFLRIHHFPHRNPACTLARSKILAQTRNEWYKKFLRQVHKSEALAYAERYAQLNAIYAQNRQLALKSNTLSYAYKNLARWYDPHADKDFEATAYEKSLAAALHHYFMESRDFALCRFKDALDLCADKPTELWLLVKLAECLAATDAAGARPLLAAAAKAGLPDLNRYIGAHLASITGNPPLKPTEKSDQNASAAKIEFHRSIFPQGVEQRYRKLTAKITRNICLETVQF